MEIPSVERIVRIKTQQEIISDVPLIEGFPQRKWRIEIWLVDHNGKEVPGIIFDRCVYHLHPTFPKPVRTIDQCPFALEEQGWGEFNFAINCFFNEDAGEVEIPHELTFQSNAYAIDYTIRVPYHIPILRERLLESGPVPKISSPTPKDVEAERSDKWMSELVSMDEDVVTMVTSKILKHPAIQSQLKKFPRDHDFVMDTRQLPDELLDEIAKYVMDQKE